MKLSDRLRMCFMNLKRRKGRTALTVIGVLIGTCSITIMMSFGFGMTEQQEKMLEGMGSLKQISVYANGQQIEDKDIEAMKQIAGVSTVSPKMQFSNEEISVLAGSNDRFKTSYTNTVGLDAALLDSLELELLEGELPKESLSRTQVLIGENFAYTFADSLRPEGQNMIYPNAETDPLAGAFDMGGAGSPDEPVKNDPYFDPLKEKMTLEIRPQSSTGEASPVRIPIEASGIAKADYNTAYETAEGLILDLDTMKNLRRQAYSQNNLQAPKLSYYEALIIADSPDAVEDIEKQIEQMGFSSSSQQSMREAMAEGTRSAQMLLGGLGAISFLVAAIGIANTMIMSVSERTREIGIMKSIGCTIRDIRLLFLSEAAVIGLLGGFLGIVISLLLSALINVAASPVPVDSLAAFWSLISETGSRLSVIPPLMIVSALLFSCLIGLISGYYPARKASRIPALEAIKYN